MPSGRLPTPTELTYQPKLNQGLDQVLTPNYLQVADTLVVPTDAKAEANGLSQPAALVGANGPVVAQAELADRACHWHSGAPTSLQPSGSAYTAQPQLMLQHPQHPQHLQPMPQPMPQHLQPMLLHTHHLQPMPLQQQHLTHPPPQQQPMPQYPHHLQTIHHPSYAPAPQPYVVGYTHAHAHMHTHAHIPQGHPPARPPHPMAMVAPPSVARHPRVSPSANLGPPPASAAQPLQPQQLAPMPPHAAAATVDMYMVRHGAAAGYAHQQPAAPQGRSMGVVYSSAQALALGAHQPVALQPAAAQPPLGNPHAKPAQPQSVACQLALMQTPQQLGQPSSSAARVMMHRWP